MSSHHHPCHPHPTTTTTYCHCYYTTPCHPPPPPDPHLLYHHHPPPPPHLHNPIQYHQHSHFQDHTFQDERQQTLTPTVSSLLLRISALESALNRRSSSSTSLRDAAARTIQTYFRAFLVRRSRTLRQLKDLAFIKSKLTLLKSSVSEKGHFDYDVVYGRAVELLRKLSFIQGGDPMIRDGKSSVRRELNVFLDFIDGFCVERRGVTSRVMRYERENVKPKLVIRERKIGNVINGDLKRENMLKLRSLVERIDRLSEELDEEEEESDVVESSPKGYTRKQNVGGNVKGVLVKKHHGGGVQPKVKKSVSFAVDGKVYRVLRSNPELVLDEDSDDTDNLVDTERDLVEVEEIGVSSKEADDDDGVEAHSESSDDTFERKRHDEDETHEGFSFSAPLPLKMETRGDVIDKRKTMDK